MPSRHAHSTLREPPVWTEHDAHAGQELHPGRVLWGVCSGRATRGTLGTMYVNYWNFVEGAFLSFETMFTQQG